LQNPVTVRWRGFVLMCTAWI